MAARLLFRAVLAFWLLYPAFVWDQPSQDAIPFVVAGQLAHDHPSAVYSPAGGGDRLAPEFRARSCPHFDDVDQCTRFAVPFISPPTAIPMAVAAAHLGGDHALQVAGAIVLVAAMALLWRTLTKASPAAAWPLALTAVLLTPLMTVSTSLGQTAPLLFLLAAVPLSAVVTWTAAVAVGALFALAIAAKAFPAALLLVPLVERRWRVVAATGAATLVLVGITFALAPADLWRGFIDSSAAIAENVRDNPYSGSIESVLHARGVDSSAAVWLVRLALALPIAFLFARLRTIDARWALAWAAALVLLPQVWVHYDFVLVAAVALLVVRAPDPRALWAVPAAAALTVPPALLTGATSHSPVLLFSIALVGLVAVAWLSLRVDAASRGA